ncbi:MAG: IS1380 family transposase, partial [Singulisphaera sp.]
MNANVHRQLARRKRRILRRLEHQPGVESHGPMMAASNIHYEVAERVRGIAPGGIGAIHLLARKLGLVDDIDRDLHLLKRHQPYFESDHVLNIAYNLLAGGNRLEHIEVRRNDEVYLDALGAERIPDPTTAGDFCRRFTEG